MNLKISPFAESDLEESISFYNSQQANLGYALFDVVNASLNRIKANPFQFPVIYNDLRKVVTPRFPFIIVFVISKECCYVLAILHNSRNPKILKDRIKTSR